MKPTRDSGGGVDVVLPDGSRECSAYPNVFIGCGTGLRRAALLEAGGLPEDFFMQAEEYDLSLRLLDAGWEIERFTDLSVWHLKTPNARIPTRTTKLDTRNNLMLITRYFPLKWALPFALDWMRRYRWIAQSKGRRHQLAFLRGLAEGVVRSCYPQHRRPISDQTFEQFARIEQIHQRMRNIVNKGGFKTILLLDVGKNLLPYHIAANRCGVRIVAIADSRLAKSDRKYRGIKVVSDDAARTMTFDAVIVANISPVHAARRSAEWRGNTRRPVFNLLEESKSIACAA